MAVPTNADVVVVRGFWIDEATGQGVRAANNSAATITFDPVPLSGASATITPNLRDTAFSSYVKTRQRVATVDQTSGYFAALLVASNDPDLDAYGGRRVTMQGESPFVIEVPYNASTMTVDAATATATGLTQGSTAKAIWLVDAALVTTPAPSPANSYLTSEQTLSTIASGLELHDEDPAAHADIRALIDSGAVVPASLAGGSTSARAAIQAIVDDAHTRGVRTVSVSPSASTYLLDGPVKLYGDMNWVAYGATFGLTGGAGKRFLANAACLAESDSVRDKNIRVLGGTYARGSLAGAGGTLDTMNLMFAFVDGIEVADVTVTSSNGKYGVYLYNCTDFHVHHCTFNVTSDGVHFTGAGRNGEIDHITGYTHDDTVAIMPRDAATWEISTLGRGDLTDVWIHDIYADTVCNVVKVLAAQSGGTVHRTDRITIERVSGSAGTLDSTETRNCLIFIGADWNTSYPQLQGGAIGRVTVDGVEQKNAVKQIVGIYGGVTIERLELGHLQGAGFRTPVVTNALNAGQWVQVDRLVIHDSHLTGAYTNADNNVWLLTPQLNNPRVSIGTLALRRVSFDSSGYGGLVRYAGGGTERPTLGLLILEDVTATNAGALARIDTDTEIRLRGVRMVTPASGAIMIQAGITGNWAGAVAITEAEGVTVPAGYQKVGKGATSPVTTIVSRDLGFPVEVDTLTPTAGTVAYNTKSALAFGVGPVAADGSSWTRLDVAGASATVPIGTQVLVAAAGYPDTSSAGTQMAQMSGAVFGAVRRFSTEPTGAGAYMQWKAPLSPGTYAADIFYRTGPNRAIIAVTVDAQQGATLDGYAASSGVGYQRQTGFVVSDTDGSVTVRVDATGANASATAYGMEISAILLTRTA